LSARKPPPPPSLWRAAPPFLLALACAGGGAALAAHHPLGHAAALSLFALACAAAACWPTAWLIGWSALLPGLALAPWSGWIAFEEFDLLTLAVAFGGYLRWTRRRPDGAGDDGAGLGWAWLWVLLWSASVVLAGLRGVVDAGGWVFDWWQAYRGPMNALRLAKPTLALWLLLPLWLHACRLPGDLAARRLTLGLVLGHGVAALACLWERLAYTGLLNFSSDYRTTGLFWEMHIGGAALDGYLALTLPFALHWWWQARSRLDWALGAAVSLLGAYAAITTFSRIVYLTLPLGIALMLALRWRATPSAARDDGLATSQRLATAVLGSGAVAAMVWIFPHAGYRGMLGVLGNATLLLMLGPRLATLRTRHVLLTAVLGLAVGGVSWAMLGDSGGPQDASKGSYLAYAAVTLGAAAAAILAKGRPRWLLAALVGYHASLVCTVLVAGHWGGAPAFVHTLPLVGVGTAALLACALRAAHRPPPWPAEWRWQAGLLGAMATAAVMVGVFDGGAYMSDRMTTLELDRGDRLQHWRSALSRVPADARWLGVGLGRFVDRFALEADPKQRPGDFRLSTADGVPTMRMVAGTHVQGWGEMLRLSQRISRPTGLATARVTLRGAHGAPLHVEVCLKHLLYEEGCLVGQQNVSAPGPDWQTVAIPLAGPPLPVDDSGTPRWTVFSLATEDAEHPIDVREISLRDADGRELLLNGRFDEQGARWFFSSDRHHMPWHAKNLAVHLLFEQGYLGLLALAGLSATALWRVCAGRARRHPLAPALAAALLGFWCVGAIDSLLDMPRVSTLFLLLNAIALSLRAPSAAARHG